MNIPVNIVFNQIPRSENVEEFIREKINKLLRYNDKINDCRVVIDLPSNKHRSFKPIRIQIVLSVPGKKLVVVYKHDENTFDQNPHVALVKAFKATIDMIKSYNDKRNRIVRVPTAQVAIEN